MSWREELRPARFRDADFRVAAHSAEPAGRRVHIHEYPGRDLPYPEDLGLKTREFSIDGYVLGEDYFAARDKLVAACAKAGPGELVHPYLGVKSVICTGCRLSERVEDGGMARFQLTFTDAGENRFPVTATDTVAAVSASADSALTTINNSFENGFSMQGMPAFVSDASVDLLSQAVAEIQAAVPSALSGLTQSALEVVASASDLVRAPAILASELTGLLSSAALGAGLGAIDPARSAVAALEPLGIFGDALAAIPLTTATRLRQSANQSAFVSLVRRAALIEQVRAAPGIAFDHAGEVHTLRDRLGDALDFEMDTASVAGDDAVVRALRDLRAVAVKDLNSRAPLLARLVTVLPAATEPALVTAYRLYADAGRAGEISARNRLRHPGFAPGGQALEVLSHG